MRNKNKISVSHKNKSEKKLSPKDKEQIEKIVKKVVQYYGETLRLLGKE